MNWRIKLKIYVEFFKTHACTLYRYMYSTRLIIHTCMAISNIRISEHENENSLSCSETVGDSLFFSFVNNTSTHLKYLCPQTSPLLPLLSLLPFRCRLVFKIQRRWILWIAGESGAALTTRLSPASTDNCNWSWRRSVLVPRRRFRFRGNSTLLLSATNWWRTGRPQETGNDATSFGCRRRRGENFMHNAHSDATTEFIPSLRTTSSISNFPNIVWPTITSTSSLICWDSSERQLVSHRFCRFSKK